MAGDDDDATVKRLTRIIEGQQFALDVLQRQIDDVMFFQLLGDVAEIELVRFTGPPSRYQPNPTAQGAGNPLILRAYTFIPRDLDRSMPQPLVVFVHGGIHANFGTGAANVVRELLAQGYTVIAPEYRGSTGYGKAFHDAIDYGGLETEDSFAARNFAVETYGWIDPERVGIIGWSHGGMHALFNIFDHPEGYAACYAAVPVSDLIARMGYKNQGYRDILSAASHIGKTADEDVAEYRRRSPAWQAHRYAGTPLLVHTNTTDEDVNVLEVEHLIKSLQQTGKPFEYKIYDAAPGGHQFNRLDTPLARQSRRDAWRFLAPHLKPAKPVAE